MNQLSIPIEVSPAEVARRPTRAGAIGLGVQLAGFEPKAVQADLRWDKGQWSRWMSGAEGLVWPKFEQLMDHCGNDVPVQWMLLQRGYDLHSLRRIESETQRENRLLREENAALRRVLLGQAARP